MEQRRVVSIKRGFGRMARLKEPILHYQCHRFPFEIIVHTLWLDHRFCLSFREVEALLAKWDISVTGETIRQWYQKFGPDYARNSISAKAA